MADPNRPRSKGRLVTFAAAPSLTCIEEDERSEYPTSGSSSSENEAPQKTVEEETTEKEDMGSDKEKGNLSDSKSKKVTKGRRRSSVKPLLDNKRRKSLSKTQAKPSSKQVTSKIDTRHRGSVKKKPIKQPPVIESPYRSPVIDSPYRSSSQRSGTGSSSQRSGMTSPSVTFSSTTTITQRMHSRMEDLVNKELELLSGKTDSQRSLWKIGYKRSKAAKMWESENGEWQRKMESSDSDSSHSDWSPSDSSEDEFALSKIPLRKTKSNLYEPGVVGVLHTLELMKKKRKKKDLHDQMKGINKRIQQALANVDMEDKSSDDEEREIRLPSIFPSQVRRDEMKRQAMVMESLTKYNEDSDHRYQLIHEVNSWISDPSSLADGLLPEDDLDQTLMQFMDIHENVMEAVQHFGGATEKVVNLGNILLKEASAIVKEHEENLKRQQAEAQEKSIVYDERALLTDSVKWENAVKMVIQTFTDAVKWTKNSSHKYIYGKGQKQFKNLSIAMKTKETELKEKRKTVEDLKTKLNITKATAEKQVKEMDEVKKSVKRMAVEIEEKKRLLGQVEQKNKGFMKKIAGYEAKIKSLEGEIETRIVEKKVYIQAEEAAAKPKPQAPPPTPEVIKVVDSATQLQLEQTETKLKESEIRVERLREKLRELDRKYKQELEKVHSLKEDLMEAEKAVEEAMEANPDPIVMPELPLEIAEMEKDSGYYKTLLTGMKREFNSEVEKLKGYLKKERSRNTAAVRRVEMNHKDHLHAIQKDILRVLRAIIHFRDHVITILDKEGLKEPSIALSQLGSLIPEKLIPDPKELLTLLVGNVVEYMHNMELTLANAFLSMRMMVKGAVEAPTIQRMMARQKSEARVMQEEHKARVRKMETAKHETLNLARRLKKAKEKLNQFEEITEISTTDRKYLALMERYRMVWKMYNRLQKDMDVLQTDFQTTMEEKMQEKEELVITQIRMDLKESKKSHEKEMKMTIADQRKNLQILAKAFDENKISKDLYDMSVSLMKKAMEIPQKRLRYLVEQYIAFKTVQETKGRVKEILADKSVSGDLRRDMINYMRRIDEKLHISMTMWHEQMAALDKERRVLFKSIWRQFTDVVAETGLLLIHPLLKGSEDRATIFERLACNMKRDKLKELMKKKKSAMNFTQLPSKLDGFNALNPYHQPKQWKNELMMPSPEPTVDTPHVVEYDVNKPQIEAKRKLSKLRRRKSCPMASIHNYTIDRDQQLQELQMK